jgi:hypothetical protein
MPRGTETDNPKVADVQADVDPKTVGGSLIPPTFSILQSLSFHNIQLLGFGVLYFLTRSKKMYFYDYFNKPD